MPIDNNLYYPKGYAMCVGINDFTEWDSKGDDNLRNCLNDVDYWSAQLKDDRSYDYVVTLKDSDATLARIIAGIWCISQKAIAGDVVFISFSTHGESNAGYNKLRTFNYDEELTEDMLRFLLKAFKPMVRVFVVTDACQSGSFLNSYESDNNITADELNSIKAAIDCLLPTYSIKLGQLIRAQSTTVICAHIVHLACINDSLNIPDGILTEKVKEVFNWTYWFNAEQLRIKIEELYESDFYEDKLDYIGDVLEAVKIDQKLRTYLTDNSSFYKMTIREYLEGCIKSNRLFDGIWSGILSKMGDFGGDKEARKKFRKVMNSWKTRKDLAWHFNPIVNYLGKSSTAFKAQYIFKKYDRSFYYENISKVS
jgi:hypothetical protein